MRRRLYRGCRELLSSYLFLGIWCGIVYDEVRFSSAGAAGLVCLETHDEVLFSLFEVEVIPCRFPAAPRLEMRESSSLSSFGSLVNAGMMERRLNIREALHMGCRFLSFDNRFEDAVITHM